MSPLNRGSLMGPRMPGAGARPLPPPRFGIGPPGTPRIPPPPINPFGHMPMRNRLPPPARLPGGVSRPNGMLPLFPGGPRARGMAPIVPPMVPPRGAGPPRAPPPRPWFRRMAPIPPMPPVHIPHMPHVRRRFNADNGNVKGKPMNNTRKVNKLEALLYPDDEDEEDESNIVSDEDTSCRERVCNREFPPKETVFEDGDHTCGIDGCTYTANSLLVEKHMRVEHDKHILVVYQDPKNTNMSTSVVQYMMDRRRRFLQIRKNLEAMESEKLEKKEIKQTCNKKPKKTTNTREKKSKIRKRRIREFDNDSVCTVDTYKGLRPFPGIGEEEEDKTCLYIDKEIEQADLCEKVICNLSDEDVPQIIIPESTNASVPTLVADYEDGTDDDEPPEVLPIKKLKTYLQDDKTTKDAVNGETCGQIKEKTSDALQISTPPTDAECTDANAKSNKRSRNDIDKCQDKQKNNKKQNCRERTAINKKNESNSHKYHNKFLESLLSRDIQHERNLICQCMRYIIDNNFFD
ncbi:nuclear fragile X mental retardation-interacting protein 1 isoform X2 [Ooceraea biroi]|uniref:nuclear fragile X mental retardation-interacting protein 1 isoform X2 n=1 Tax=Ooceraea biroi TaxID=2015173 RepID=UPI0005B9CE5C|nr:nuclear fragile X mental retardation-interacting protein 1 isoform X2 [Ooceraea biroi]